MKIRITILTVLAALWLLGIDTAFAEQRQITIFANAGGNSAADGGRTSTRNTGGTMIRDRVSLPFGEVVGEMTSGFDVRSTRKGFSETAGATAGVMQLGIQGDGRKEASFFGNMAQTSSAAGPSNSDAFTFTTGRMLGEVWLRENAMSFSTAEHHAETHRSGFSSSAGAGGIHGQLRRGR